MTSSSQRDAIAQIVVRSAQMRAIEECMFAAGMPVAALMEKVAGLLARQLLARLGRSAIVGVIVGPGHNGGDALVIARELHHQGYPVRIWQPFPQLKELTQAHANYARHLGIPWLEFSPFLAECTAIVDGLFGFGLEREISGETAAQIRKINRSGKPIFSIDLPSGIHTDTGEVLGEAIKASHTFCLGLWKQAVLQDSAIDYMGNVELIDFDIPLPDIDAVLAETQRCYRITRESAIAALPLPRPLLSHKYTNGHLLLVCGSQQYAGSAILTGLGARASGVGMLSIAVPESLKHLLVAQLPEALVIGCPETEEGAIAKLPDSINLQSYQAIACGPGLTRSTLSIIEQLLHSPVPLILDADGLNNLVTLGISHLHQRKAPTILTPHAGEFKRLFPQIKIMPDRIHAARQAATESGTVVILKGAKTAIADPEGTVWVNPESTPALARGGSGDVLAGLLGGVIAQGSATVIDAASAATAAVWWHGQAGILAAEDRSVLGVDAFHLTEYLTSSILARE